MANLHGFEPAEHSLPVDKLLTLDKWIIEHARRLQQQIIAAYDNYEFHVIYQLVHNFCAVEMGSFYLDVIKDRQYTTQQDSIARRSAQTALYHVVEAMARWLAPILSFTAEDIWQVMPGKREESVLLATWYDVPAMYSSDSEADKETAFWHQVIEVRDAVNKELEALRIAGGIGSGLDAEVDLYCGRELYDLLSKLEDELRFALITSYARIYLAGSPPAEGQHYTLSNNDEIWVAVAASAHAKCIRCWHHREDVGSHAKHPELCGRCIENVDASGEQRQFA